MRLLVTRALALVALVSVLTGCTTRAVLAPREPTPGVPHRTGMRFNGPRDEAGDAGTVSAIGEPDADIVCLQEITPAWERAVRERYATQYPYMVIAPQDDAGGLAVLSRFPLEDHGIMRFQDDWHPAMRVVAETPAGRVQVVHVHLRSMFEGRSNPLASFVKRSGDHLSEIRTYKGQAEAGIPTIVAGDFNENQKGKAVRWLEARGFQNALRLYRPRQHTWRGRTITRPVKMTIDHVLFDQSFEPLDAWVARRGASDHYPVLAHLEVPAAAVSLGPDPAPAAPTTSETLAAPLRAADEAPGAIEADGEEIDPDELRDPADTLVEPPR